MFERDYNSEITVKVLLEKYRNEMTNEGAYFIQHGNQGIIFGKEN